MSQGSAKRTADPGSHTVASHSDTTGTGAELETLTDGSETTLHSHAGGGASLPDWISYLTKRQSGETSHTDDDFFDNASKAGTEQTVSGTAVWTELYDKLSVRWNGQSSGDAAAYLNAMTPTVTPITIETAFSGHIPNGTFHGIAVCFTDGTTSGSNHASSVMYRSATNTVSFQERAGTLTSMAASVGNVVESVSHPLTDTIYMRIVWTASNTFESAYSVDGITWTDFGGGSFSKTMTPTHFGVFVSSSGSSKVGLAGFHYLRVNELDLSA